MKPIAKAYQALFAESEGVNTTKPVPNPASDILPKTLLPKTSDKLPPLPQPTVNADLKNIAGSFKGTSTAFPGKPLSTKSID